MPLINPTNKYKELWDAIIVIWVLIASVEIPFRLAFDYPLEGPLVYMELAVTIFFGLDILLNMITTYPVGMKMETDRTKVFIHYIKGWFIVDFIAFLPFFLSYLNSESEVGDAVQLLKALRLLQLGRLLKLVRMNQIIKSFQKRYAVNPSLFRLLSFLLLIGLAAHWIACSWIVLGGVDPLIKEWPEAYSLAIYWAVTTLTTVGYGDITPTTSPQRYFTIVVMFAGVGTYGYVIGNVASFLANMDIVKAGYRKKMEEISAFLIYRAIPVDLQKRVHEYYDHLWESRMGHDESALLEDIPEPLKSDLALFMRQDLLKKVPFFKEASHDLLRDIVMTLKPKVYLPDTYVIRKGEPGTFMFIVSSGQVDVMNEDNTTSLITLHEGSFVGEMALVLEQPRTAGVKTRGYCDLYILEKDDFDKILERYPDFANLVREITNERLEETKKRKKG